ncbi:MAG: PIG-L family deacetylase [bacterium]|nr:PIG-L family deacetylase [bacterium]
MAKKLKILAIGAHSDDIEYYAGGTLLQMSETHDIYFVVATDGQDGYHNHLIKENIIEMRKNEQKASVKLLHVKKIWFLDFPDGKLVENDFLLKMRLLEVFSILRPDIVFSFDTHRQHIAHDDYHPDHRILAHTVLDISLIDVTLPARMKKPMLRPKVYLYNPEKANLRVNIEEFSGKKKKILEKFKSQNLDLKSGLFKFEKFRVY